MKRVLFFLFFPLLLSSCATLDTAGDHTRFELAGDRTVYRDQWTRRDPPLVYVRPKDAAGADLSALFVPFRVTQPITNPEIVGYSEARTVWQTWLSMELFPAMEFSSDLGPYRRDRALAMARSKGADIVVGGFVTYYFAGGTAGNSQVALQVEIHDARSGELIWSMAQSALMPASETNDFLLFATKTRLPSDPIYVLTKVIAQDMGAVIRASLNPASVTRSTGLKKFDEDVAGSMRGRDRPAPATSRPPVAKEQPSF